MAKGQQRSNKETRKPKQKKVAPGAPTATTAQALKTGGQKPFGKKP